MKVLTIVEGKIPLQKAREFENNFASVKKEPLPPGFVTSSLIKNSKTPETYRIQTLWESRETLEKMRSNTQTPKAIELFQRMGAVPVLEIYDVVENVP